jgi:hypothetical protein
MKTPEIEAQPWHDAAGEVEYQFHRYVNTNDIVNRADALIKLSNAVFDLKTWLPGFDSDTGTLPWEREDEE